MTRHFHSLLRSSADSVAPAYPGLIYLGGDLPRQTDPWPHPPRHAAHTIVSDEEQARELILRYARSRRWEFPKKPVVFISDVHADADGFWRSLLAARLIEKTGPADADFELTEFGAKAKVLIGGDCFDKGPSNLRLLRCLRLFMKAGAKVDILAGNHDLRTLVGLRCLGRNDALHAHLFVRMGKKSAPLFAEIREEYPEETDPANVDLTDDEIRYLFFPNENWYESFPKAARGWIPEAKIEKELRRIREKGHEFEAKARSMGMSLKEVYASVMKARELFLSKKGEFAWFFSEMMLAKSYGSFLFIHAGVDDEVAADIREDGVKKLNKRFRKMLSGDLFELYHGPLGNCLRTKYRELDRPLTTKGVRDLHEAGIYAIVHGHKNVLLGQHISMHSGMLNFECDASIDINTRKIEGLSGVGGAATIVDPAGSVHGVSTDYPLIKVFTPAPDRDHNHPSSTTTSVDGSRGTNVVPLHKIPAAFWGEESKMAKKADSAKKKSKKAAAPKEAVAEEKKPQLSIAKAPAESKKSSSKDGKKDAPKAKAEKTAAPKNKISVDGVTSIEEVQAYIKSLADSLKSGSVKFLQGNHSIVLTPTSHVQFELKASQKSGKHKISLELNWQEGSENDVAIKPGK
ncbi:MAG: amphi-Trp domain-containing protein [Deltaproteobacteria bacterium]|nr:amphi-Trp domain-containing protein [Deltaproteobacteria bacterium]